MKRALLEQNPMVIGQAEVAELVRDCEAPVPLVADARRIAPSSLYAFVGSGFPNRLHFVSKTGEDSRGLRRTGEDS